MARDLQDFARSCAAFPEALQKAQKKGTGAAALHVTTGIRREIRGVTGGDMQLSHYGTAKTRARGGRKINVGYDIRGTVDPTALIKPRGAAPLKLIEYGASPHEITLKTRRTSIGAPKAMPLPGGRFARKVSHPGTGGKHPWAHGVDQTKHDTVKIYEAEVFSAMKRTFS